MYIYILYVIYITYPSWFKASVTRELIAEFIFLNTYIILSIAIKCSYLEVISVFT